MCSVFWDGPFGATPLVKKNVKQFTIKGAEPTNYQPPQNISPVDGSIISESDIKKPITFRWTPVIPKPQEPVTYRLRVWQLMQGQTLTQAIKVNQPIITKDVDNITQAIVTNIYYMVLANLHIYAILFGMFKQLIKMVNQ